MLYELRVENLLLIERAELQLDNGLNVLTGETGAGKTVLAHALDLLLGGKPRSGIVRPGAKEAYVEGVFGFPEELRETLDELLAPEGDEIVLARRVSASGRSRAYVGGRSANVADLRDISSKLVSFYGQHEHRKLMLASAQLDILDSFSGTKQTQRRAHFGAHFAKERELQRLLAATQAEVSGRERELDLLEWELREIEAAAIEPEEEAKLLADRIRLRNTDRLHSALSAGLDVVGAEEGGAVELLVRGARALDEVRDVDSQYASLAGRVNSLVVEAQDIECELRTQAELIDASPARLDEVEERLAQLDRLKRKHGGTIESVLAYAESCRHRRAELTGAEENIEKMTSELAEIHQQLSAAAESLRGARISAGKDLAQVVRKQLSKLAMDGATFEVDIQERAEYVTTGGDQVEFLIAPNPGVAKGPLRETASGGELSRIMLALMSVAATEGPATLVFDEIDAGIGGHTARAVGEQLQQLAQKRQIICITHLPQIAALADRHFTIVKDTSEETALTTVNQLGTDELIEELVRMLGSATDDKAARRHAQEMLKTGSQTSHDLSLTNSS